MLTPYRTQSKMTPPRPLVKPTTAKIRFAGTYATEEMMKMAEGCVHYTKISNHQGIAYLTGPELKTRTQHWKELQCFKRDSLEYRRAQRQLSKYEARLIEKALNTLEQIILTLD